MRRTVAAGLVLPVLAGLLAWAAPPPGRTAPEATPPPEGWTTAAPRTEIRPDFAYEPAGGPDGRGTFVIRADQREGLDGCWARSFPVTGGRHYRFRALYRAKGVAVPRRSVVARIDWRDTRGQKV